MDLSMRVFFAFILLFRFVFCLLLFFFFPVKKQNTCKIKAKNKSKKPNKCKKMQMDKTIFSPFFPFWRSFFFPIYFASCSFPVLKCCFLIIHVFSFFCIFSSLKIIWTSYRGQHNTTTTPTPTPTPTPAPTPLPLPPFCTTLVVPVANDIAYSITVVYRYSSQDAQGTDRPVLM